MFKGTLKAIIALYMLLFFYSAHGQTIGFVTFKNSYDTLWNLFQTKTKKPLDSFMVNEQTWNTINEKKGKSKDPRLVHAFYIEYQLKVQKGYNTVFKKTHSKKKKNWNYKKMNLEKTTRQAVSDSGDLIKVSLYFTQKKRFGVLTYYLWKIDGIWYLIDKMKIEEVDPF